MAGKQGRKQARISPEPPCKEAGRSARTNQASARAVLRVGDRRDALQHAVGGDRHLHISVSMYANDNRKCVSSLSQRVRPRIMNTRDVGDLAHLDVVARRRRRWRGRRCKIPRLWRENRLRFVKEELLEHELIDACAGELQGVRARGQLDLNRLRLDPPAEGVIHGHVDRRGAVQGYLQVLVRVPGGVIDSQVVGTGLAVQ